MFSKNKSLFTIYILFSMLILSLGIFFLVGHNHEDIIHESDASETYAYLTFKYQYSISSVAPEYSNGASILGEDGVYYDPYTDTPKISITASCSEDLYMDGVYMGDNNGSHTQTYTVSDGTQILIRAFRKLQQSIATFNISVSINNSYTNDYCVTAELGGASSSLILGGMPKGEHYLYYTYYLQYRPDYWWGYFYLNDGTDDQYTTIMQTNYRYWNLPLEKPVRDGYIFDGWWTEKTGGSEITSTTLFKRTESQTVYAHWIKNDYYKLRTDSSGEGLSTPYIISVTNPINNYPFVLNSNGYYESTNKGVNNSYSLCKVSFYVHQETNVSFTVINYAESNYDFGIFSKLNTVLSPSYTEDSSTYVHKSFRGSSSSGTQTVKYSDVSPGYYYIYVKFRKDGSANSGNDSLQFKFSNSGSPSSTYSSAGVSNIYPFTLNSDGYYESTNKGVHSSYAMSKVSFYVPRTMNLNFSVINYAESNFDYGVFSKLNTSLDFDENSTTNVHKSFRGLSQAGVQKVTYTNVPAGNHYIHVKFRKDGSNHSNNDSIKFKLDEEVATVYDYDESIYQANLSKTGYQFDGWSAINLDTSSAKRGTSSGAVTKTWTDGNTKVTDTYFKNLNSDMGTVTLTANFSPRDYRLYAYLNPPPNSNNFASKVNWSLPSSDWSLSGDKLQVSIYVEYDSKYGSLPIPSREGYTFKGWFDTSSSSGGNSVSSETHMKEGICGWTSNNDNAKIYARWTVNTYTVTFNQNGGSGGTGSTTATYDSTMPGITIPKRIGYSFGGYYDTPQASSGVSGGGTQYYTSSGASARSWDKASNTTLYARWLPRTDYKIDINILNPNYVQDYASGTMTQTYGSQTFTGTDQSFDKITFKESWTISNITPKHGYILTSVSADAGTLTDNKNGTYTFTANFNKDPSGDWDAAITIQMGYTWAEYGTEPTGSGASTDPYIIDSAEDLAWMIYNHGSKLSYFKQTKTINLKEKNINGENVDLYWYPIGTSASPFKGVYNGQGYPILNLKTSPNMVERAGLFGYIQDVKGNEGIVENVMLLNSHIQGSHDIGSIAGRSIDGTIRNCYVEGNVTGTNRGIANSAVEGLVGYSTGGLIEKCYFSGTVSGKGDDKQYGLITCENSNGSIKDCIGKTTGSTAFYGGSAQVDSCLYLTDYDSLTVDYKTKRYYGGSFSNWVISNSQPLPAGLTWIGGSDAPKVTNISQIEACGYVNINQ